jgi:hypothetical protein
MRRTMIGLVVLAVLTACSDSSPTSTTAPALKTHPRSVIVTGSLDDNINSIINLWPNGQETQFHNQWNQIKLLYDQGQTNPIKLDQAKKQLNQLIKSVVQNTGKMQDDPPDGESPQSAASRMILYMLLYVYDGPNTTPPPYFPGADNAVGLLTPNQQLTLVTPSGDAGAQFPAGSTDVDRVIVITQNPTPWGECDGPLTTNLCQYPLFYDITSFPDTKLLQTAKAAVCHPPEGSDRGPSEEVHPYLRLAHTKPANPSDYTPGSIVPTDEGEDIEILPLITQTFVVCTDVEYDPPPGDLYEYSALRDLRKLASKVGRFFLPKSAYAIDQGGGGGFEIFSPFNNVDASPYLIPEID